MQRRFICGLDSNPSKVVCIRIAFFQEAQVIFVHVQV